MKFFTAFLFTGLLAFAPVAGASVIPPVEGGCALTVRVAQAIPPDRIAFTVETTDCPWLKPGTTHESSSISVDAGAGPVLAPGAALSGTAMQGSSNGPHGPVSWTQFRGADLSFTF